MDETTQEELAENNVLVVAKLNNEGYVMMTTFDGRDFDNNYRESLTKLVTAIDYRFFQETEVPYLPHIVKTPDKTPQPFKSFVEEKLESFEEHTMIIFRFFEKEGEILTPVLYGFEDEVDKRSKSNGKKVHRVRKKVRGDKKEAN